jgi:Tol biopolymer transport system component
VNSSEKHAKQSSTRIDRPVALVRLPGVSRSGALSRVGSLFGVLIAVLVFAASASAAPSRPFKEVLGPAAQPSFGEAEGVAVDQSSGDLLVIDHSAGTVDRYHEDGTPADFSALGTNVIDGIGASPSCTPPSAECDGTPQEGLFFGPATEVQVAVDNSGGATDGDIYVTQSGAHLVDIFAADGEYLGQLTESSSGPLGEVCGVAVGPEGDVYLGDYDNGVYKFSNPPVDGAGQLLVTIPEVCNLAVGAGSLFVTYDAGPQNVTKFDATTGLEDYELAPGPDTTVSVDPDTGNVFVAGEETVTEYHAGASTAQVISSTELDSAVQGIAVDEGSGNLYASREGGEHVEIFGLPVYGSQAPKLKVVKNGSGTGTVTSAPAGISCGSTCSATFPENEVVKLTGVPGANTQPVEWTGCDAVTGSNECEVTMSAAREVTATFTLVKHSLTVTKSGPGPGTVTGGSAGEPDTINCGPICGHEYPHGTLVTLQGTGNPRPAHWTGCDTVNGADECEVTLIGAKLVDAEFPPLPDPPLVTTDSAGAGPEPDLMTLEGRVDPNGFAVGECEFLYGPNTSYGESTPCVPAAAALGNGTGDVSVTAITEPLDPDTTYHFRLQASNPGGMAQGEDKTFTTGAAAPDSCPNAAIRAEQGAKALHLPDCMALEMVSPAVKNQQYAREPSVSADGDRVLFTSSATLGGTPLRISAGGDLYVASRGPSGWQTASTSPPPAFLQKEPEEPAVASLSPDFSHWFLLAGTGGKPVSGVAQAFQSGLGGALSPISPVLTPLSGPGGLTIKDSSVDRSHIYLQTSAFTSYLSGDPEPEGFRAESNTYVAGLDPGGSPSLALLARGRDGKAWGGECGARLGGIEPNQLAAVYLADGLRSQGAVSPDGRRVYFSTRPDQPAAGPCLDTSKMRIMVREETATGPKIEELFQSECDRVAPACGTAVGDDSYQGASVDQTRVYFTTNRQLVDTDRDGDGSSTSCSNETGVPGCDLYVYDSTKPAGERLTQVSAGDASDPTPGEGADVVSGITAISADGSHVYFVADGVLTERENSEGAEAQEGHPNLYAYTYPAKELAFVGTLTAADHGFAQEGLFGGGSTWEDGAYPVPVMGTDAQGRQIGGDGHILLFRSKAALTAGDTNGAADIFRYDADSGSLERISAPEPGGSDSGAFDATTAFSSGLSGPAFAVTGRWVSEDGDTVVFSTAQPLVPGDVNGLVDSYMWRDGKLFRIPGTAKLTAENFTPHQPTLSPDGSTVAFTSEEVKLLPGDGDSAADVYVARVDGGYPPPPPAPACAGEEGCQGAPATSPGQIGAASSTFAGTGNPKASPRRPKCHKGKARRHGRCVKRQTKKPHHTEKHQKEKHHKRPHRSAGRGHGDSR